MHHVLVIHHDKATRTHLESLLRGRHEVEGAVDLVNGIKQMARRRPDVIVVGHDREKGEGLRLLKYLRDNVLKTPVVAVLGRGAGTAQPALMKLGAKAILESPVTPERMQEAIVTAIEAKKKADAGPPPISEEELQSNLSVLERSLNGKMRCFAGRNQVYIQSMILGRATSRPRIALKCSLRAEYGLNKDVYYEFIRDVCCQNPGRCEAVERFQAERETA